MFVMCCSVLMAQSKVERAFDLDRKIVYKLKGEGAEKMRDLVTDFLKKENLIAAKRSKSAVDTIFITEYHGNKKNIESGVDIYKHSIEIYYKGDEGRNKAYDLLVSKYVKTAGSKKAARHSFTDHVVYSNLVDLTKSNMNIRELHESIDVLIENGADEIQLKLYSANGISILSPNYKLFNPKESFSRFEMCSTVDLLDILKQHVKKSSFVFVIDFSNDENSHFREVMGYNALSDEGCRVLRPFIKELALLLKMGTFEILYDNDDLKLKCFIEPLFDSIDPKRTKITVMNSVKEK